MRSVCPKLVNNPVPIQSVSGAKPAISGSSGKAVGRAFTMTVDEARSLPDIFQAGPSGKRKEN